VARNKNQSFEKRKREQARQERAAQKRAKRQARAESGGSGQSSDIDDIAIGQPQDKASDDEVQRAIERAMNPGAQHAAAGKRGKPFGKRLFVGNLDRATEEHEIGAFFREGGFHVVEATLMLDRMTGESRGFAFVELDDGDQAKRAIAELGGTALHGRELRINMAD